MQVPLAARIMGFAKVPTHVSVSVKSGVFVPASEILEMVRDPVPECVMTIGCAADALPASWGAKVTVAGASEITGWVAIPESGTVMVWPVYEMANDALRAA